MKTAWGYLLVAGLAFAATSCHREPAPPAAEKPSDPVSVKPPNVAGAFYPAAPEALAETVESRLREAGPSLRAGEIVAIVTPHAGYEYSGGVAATAYRQLEGRRPATVVLLGPSHYSGEGGIAAATYDAFETPLGVVEVDAAFVADVAERCPDVTYSNVPYAKEHCLEVQLPFIQTLFPQARLAPFIFCEHDAEAAERFGRAVAEVAASRGTDVLIVTTCDLSHYHPYKEAVRLDRAFLDTFEKFDAEALSEAAEGKSFEIDAPGPMAATLWCAGALGATEAIVLEYNNSGDVTGDVSGGVVGYFAGALVKPSMLPRAEER